MEDLTVKNNNDKLKFTVKWKRDFNSIIDNC